MTGLNIPGMHRLKKMKGLIEAVKTAVYENFETLVRYTAVSIEYAGEKYTIEFENIYRPAEVTEVTEEIYYYASQKIRALCVFMGNVRCGGVEAEKFSYTVVVKKGEKEVMTLKAETIHLPGTFFTCEEFVELVPCAVEGGKYVVLTNVVPAYVNLEYIQ